MIRLGEILIKSADWIQLQPDQMYKEVTVRLWGKGATLRREVLGAEIASDSRLRVHANQFIISRIDARNGASAVIPDDLEGAVVSNDFPVFTPNPDRLDPRFLGWLSTTRGFVEISKAASEGTTNRVRLKEDRFLATTIPLPPLTEQRRLVERIDAVATKVREAKELRDRALIDQVSLWRSALAQTVQGKVSVSTDEHEPGARELLAIQAAEYKDLTPSKHNNANPAAPIIAEGPSRLPRGWVWTTLGSVLSHLVDCVNDTPNFSETETDLLGLKSTNVKPFRLDLRLKWHVTEEDFATWNRRQAPLEGDIALTREAPMGQACLIPGNVKVCLTQRLMLLRTDERFVHNAFVLYYLNSDCFLDQVRITCRGLTTPHIRVQDAPNFLIPLPPLRVQHEIVKYLRLLQSRIQGLESLHTATAAELDALLPAILDRAFKGELL
jgi:type I restriction enzyme S subunit